MEIDKRNKIAMFRFSVINTVVGVRNTQRGEKEKLLQDITSKQWDIPYSGRSYISRSTILGWIKRYKESGFRLESLYPFVRKDKGRTRALDSETELALINLKRELKNVSLHVLLRVARDRRILQLNHKISSPTIYRIFKRHGIDKEVSRKTDMRRFESELPNDLWQSDCMHGPKINVEGRLRKTYLFTFIDDHSRIIPHVQFYLNENIQSYLDSLRQALLKRGLPRKLYVDNGPSFRSHHLGHVTASLGIALIHATPYYPQGKGKIERLHKTIRMRFLPLLKENITLNDLNIKIQEWVNNEYHLTVHSSTKQKPLERYQKHLHLIRGVPQELPDYFRKRVIRKVDKDRTISLDGRVYESPVGLVGQKVTLLYHDYDPDRVEVFFNNKTYGFLTKLNPKINAYIKRKNTIEIIDNEPPVPSTKKTYPQGELF